VEEWIVEITDMTATVGRILRLCEEGAFDRAKRLLPREQRYDVPIDIATRLGMLLQDQGHGGI
jgi:hypothetical protein